MTLFKVEKHKFQRLIASYGRDQSGAVAVLFSLCMVALIGVIALAHDLGKVWNLDTELQNAADAAALAGATQLDNQPGARARATTAATGALAQNDQTFASDGLGSAVNITAANIRFLVTLGGAVATTDADANYIEVTTNTRQSDFTFAAALGAVSSASPDAQAVAGMGAAYCKVPPMFFCQPSGGLAALQPGMGVWLKGKNSGGSTSWGSGNFGILALHQSDGGTTLSASAITDAMGRINPIAECYSPDGTVTTKPGQTTSIMDGLNMRFDIEPTGTHGVPSGEPPVSSNPQYQPSANTVKGLYKQGSQCRLASGGGGSPGWKKLPAAEQFQGPGHPTAGITAMTYPRDNCAYPADGTNPGPNAGGCIPSSTTGADGRFGDGTWDRQAYIDTYHSSTTLAAINGQVNASSYADTDVANLSRFEIHQWEIATGNIPHTVGEETADTMNNPVCYSGAFIPVTQERRVVTLAVLDCTGLSGSTTVNPVAYYNLFFNGTRRCVVEYRGRCGGQQKYVWRNYWSGDRSRLRKRGRQICRPALRVTQ